MRVRVQHILFVTLLFGGVPYKVFVMGNKCRGYKWLGNTHKQHNNDNNNVLTIIIIVIIITLIITIIIIIIANHEKPLCTCKALIGS